MPMLLPVNEEGIKLLVSLQFSSLSLALAIGIREADKPSALPALPCLWAVHTLRALAAPRSLFSPRSLPPQFSHLPQSRGPGGCLFYFLLPYSLSLRSPFFLLLNTKP